MAGLIRFPGRDSAPLSSRRVRARVSESAPADTRPLVERRRPQRLREMVGNARALRDLRTWAQGWVHAGAGTPRWRAALLEGPPGVGKTTAAHALARELGWTVVEMNASDARNEAAISEVAGRASMTNTLGDSGTYVGSKEGGRTLILLDEADCLTGRATEPAAARAAPPSLREFLRGRYRSVEALATAWGLGQEGAPAAFASWEAVPATGGRGAWTRLAPAQRDLADWRGTRRPRDTTDRGGLAAIARLVRETRQPLLLTVNDSASLVRYSPVFRQVVQRIRFAAVPPEEMRAHVERVATAEHVRLPASVVETLVQRSQGDVRAALTDLEAISVRPDAVTATTLFGRRDLASDYYELLDEVFAHPRFYRSVEVRDRLDATPDDLLPWVEENLPRSGAPPRARYEAYEVLGRAEQFLSWARRYRVYALWSFATELMTGGVSVELGQGGRAGRADLGFPEFLGAMGRTRALRATRLALATKAGHRYHASRRKVVESFLPLLEQLFRPGRAPREHDEERLRRRRAIARDLELSAEEVAFLMHLGPDDREVLAIVGPEPAVARTAAPAEPEEEPQTAPPKAESRRVQRRLGDFGS